jgi:hypothetical protein
MCKKELLEIFGMKGTKMSIPRLASPEEKTLCRRNQETCCDSRNIMSIAPHFSETVRNFRRKFEVLEELFSLFRGPKFINLINKISSNDPCMHNTSSMFVRIEERNYYFPSDAYMSVILDKIQVLTEDLNYYLKNIIWFHGNMVCTICNPNYQKYFDVGLSYSMLGFNSNNCLETFEEKDFELRLMKIYNDFFVPVFKTLNCSFSEKIEEIMNMEYFTLEEIEKIKKEKAKYKKNNHQSIFGNSNLIGYEMPDDKTYNGKVLNPRNNFLKIIEIPAKRIEEAENVLLTCKNDLQASLEECKKLCKKQILYNVQLHKGLFSSLQSILSILFYLITENTIESFYRNFKSQKWNHGEFDKDFDFFEYNSYAYKYKFYNINWIFSKDTGLDLYSETISKKFLKYFEDSQSILSVLICFLFVVFLSN